MMLFLLMEIRAARKYPMEFTESFLGLKKTSALNGYIAGKFSEN